MGKCVHGRHGEGKGRRGCVCCNPRKSKKITQEGMVGKGGWRIERRREEERGEKRGMR